MYKMDVDNDELRRLIVDLIRNEYDKAPEHYAMGDNWDDGAEDIANKIVAAITKRGEP